MMRKYNYIIFLLLFAGLQLSFTELFGQEPVRPGVPVTQPDTNKYKNDDILILPIGLKTTQRTTVGAISKIIGQALESYPDLLLSNTLQGKLMGLTVRQTSNGLGNNSASLYVRGLSRGGSDEPLTIVDGIERDINFLNPEEIESIEVLKDASSKILYGPRAANGIILVTTKRGKENSRQIKVSASYGTNMARRMPEYLNSYDYATLYNEARLNDGLPAFYSAKDLEGYRNSSGVNDQRYPDVDYYDYFLNNSAPFRKANFEYSGGGTGNKYAFMLGYVGANGFEKIGKTPTQDRINLRGNLDFEISPSLKAFIDANAIVEARSWSKLGQSSVFSALNSHRPNEYPFIITDPVLQGVGNVIGQSYIPPMGGSLLHPNNLYGDLTYGGYSKHNYFYGQTNFGLDLNLGKVIKGLSVKSVFTFDNYQFFQSGKSETPRSYARVYTQNPDGTESVSYVTVQKQVVQSTAVGEETVQDQNIIRNMGWMSNLSYSNHFGKNDLGATLSHFYYRNENKASAAQDIENSNSVFRLNYSFNNKIYAEGTLALMGTNKFAAGNRFGLFPAIGASWILSEENFLKDNSVIDFLKVKSSFGVLGYDRATAFYLFQDRWYDNGSAGFGQPNAVTNVGRTTLDILGNENLNWEKSRELNIGIESSAFRNVLQFEFNYFNTYRYDMILSPDNLYSSFTSGLYPRLNMGETKNAGVEGNVKWHTKAGQVNADLGFNFIYSKNKVVVTNEISYPDHNLSITGQSSDSMFGYVSNGLFTSPEGVAGSPTQSFGAYGQGDLAYKDINGDGLIDGRDVAVIGNSFPRVTMGIDINLNYKGFGLYLLGTSELGVNAMANSSYYRNNGEGKYSIIASDRYHPVNNPSGTYPKLTTTTDNNNVQSSTFWLRNTDFLRLKNVELSYGATKVSSWFKGYKVFLRGTNLLVLSAVRDMDPEALSAGVTNYPIYRTVTLGVSVKF